MSFLLPLLLPLLLLRESSPLDASILELADSPPLFRSSFLATTTAPLRSDSFSSLSEEETSLVLYSEDDTRTS